MLSVVQPSQACQHQNQSANAGGQVAVNHFDPGFAVRDRAARQNGLGLGNLLGGSERAGAAVAAWPVGAAQARVCQARESTKQDQIKGQEQGQDGQGLQTATGRRMATSTAPQILRSISSPGPTT